MKPFRLFDADGLARLRHLANDSDATPRPTPAQRESLAAVLKESAATDDPAELAQRVGAGDHVRLVAPDDPSDWFAFELVMPTEADVDADRISLLTPMGIALLGRRIGDLVCWEVPAGERKMQVDAVNKPVSADA